MIIDRVMLMQPAPPAVIIDNKASERFLNVSVVHRSHMLSFPIAATKAKLSLMFSLLAVK
jgi:hypothetical protein